MNMEDRLSELIEKGKEIIRQKDKNSFSLRVEKSKRKDRITEKIKNLFDECLRPYINFCDNFYSCQDCLGNDVTEPYEICVVISIPMALSIYKRVMVSPKEEVGFSIHHNKTFWEFEIKIPTRIDESGNVQFAHSRWFDTIEEALAFAVLDI